MIHRTTGPKHWPRDARYGRVEWADRGSQGTMDCGPNRCRVKARGRVQKISKSGCRYKEIIRPSLHILSTRFKKPLRAFMTAVGNWGGCDRHKKAREPRIVEDCRSKQVVCDMKKPLRAFGSRSSPGSSDRHKKAKVSLS